MSDDKNINYKKTVNIEDFIVGYEMTWYEGTRLIMINLLWSSVLFLIAVLI
jgi:hypothetical protein